MGFCLALSTGETLLSVDLCWQNFLNTIAFIEFLLNDELIPRWVNDTQFVASGVDGNTVGSHK